MLDVADDLRGIWFIVIAVIGAVIWLVRLEGRVNTSVRDQDEMKGHVNRLFAKADKLDVLDKQVATVTSMMRPEAVAEYHRSDERIKARLDRLEETVAEIKRKDYQGG